MRELYQIPDLVSCYASKLNTETGSPARPTRIVEKLTVKLDAQQLITLSVSEGVVFSR